MSVNNKFFNINPVDFAVSQAGQSNKAGAFNTLTTAYALTPEQTRSIQAILHGFQTAVTGESALKRDIVTVLGNEILQAISQTPEQISTSIPQDQDMIVFFLNDSASVFANHFPCQLEFGGKYYPNATVCFLAQQYTDQPQMMDLLIECGTTEEAVALTTYTPMTTERKLSWEDPDARHINQLDVMMHVLRAKFGQNPELKKQLLCTENTFLVCQGNDGFLSDNFDGTGKNILGMCLMQLRAEYSGIEIVDPNTQYLKLMKSLRTRCHLLTNELSFDFIEKIFSQCLIHSDYNGLSAMACLNWNWYECSRAFWDPIDLKQFCPGLNILNAKKPGIKIDDEPTINKLVVVKLFKKLSSKVEGDKGLTLLTMSKGITAHWLVENAERNENTTVVWPIEIERELRKMSVLKTYVILITNNVFIGSLNMSCDQRQACTIEHGCEEPTVLEYMALCLLSRKIFNQRLYGTTPITFGQSSTKFKNCHLIVGCFDKLCGTYGLNVQRERHDKDVGAAGRRKLG